MKGFEARTSLERTANKVDDAITKIIDERFGTFTEMGELEQMAALSQVMFLPEVKENMVLADRVAKLLSDLETKHFGYLQTPHETAGMPTYH